MTTCTACRFRDGNDIAQADPGSIVAELSLSPAGLFSAAKRQLEGVFRAGFYRSLCPKHLANYRRVVGALIAAIPEDFDPDWTAFGSRRSVFDRRFDGKYSEVILLNASGREIGVGYTTADALADRDRRRALALGWPEQRN